MDWLKDTPSDTSKAAIVRDKRGISTRTRNGNARQRERAFMSALETPLIELGYRPPDDSLSTFLLKCAWPRFVTELAQQEGIGYSATFVDKLATAQRATG
ncbi:hypothetical protein [Cupriavidus oxalaticus]|uniref:hypothetical protein n=1 Tax=Cupriavidus oxalaticus TaxID=96344 RepID=UPI003F734278